MSDLKDGSFYMFPDSVELIPLASRASCRGAEAFSHLWRDRLVGVGRRKSNISGRIKAELLDRDKKA